MRKLTRLKPRVKLLTDFYVFDTETGKKNKDGSIQWHLNARPESFQFGVIYGHNYTKVIYSLKEFHETLKEPRFKDRKVFAHNAEYDLNVLFGNIFDLDPSAIFNGKFICATNGVCQFADSYNIYSTSVKELGKLVGIEKPDLGNETMFSPNGITASEINRCIVDCQIVYEVLIRIFEDAGDIKITQASLSMTYFRRHHLKHDIEHNENTSFFWDSYFGGRCEAFKLGKTHSKVIDINSSYPYAMKHVIFPNPKFLKVEINVPTKLFLQQLLPYYEGCIYCTVKHPDFYFGLLPLKQHGKLIFPNGTFSGCWNFNELRFALDNGVEILNITRVVYADRMPSPFIDYVDKLYLQRFKTDNKLEQYRIKIFMNSLYGKFAQRIDEETIYIRDVTKEIETIREYQKKNKFIKLQMFNSERLDAFLILKSSKNYNLSYSIPSFASYITSFSRVHLLKKLIQLKNNRVVYCDTDSVFFEIENSEPDSSELGGWKIEGAKNEKDGIWRPKIITEIKGLKNYKYVNPKTSKEDLRLKGVPKNAVQTSDNTFEYSNLMKTKEGLRRSKDSGVITKRTKKILGLYTKRIVLSNGETQPIKL